MTQVINTPATDKQVAFINALLRQRAVSEFLAEDIAATDLTKENASKFIEMLKAIPFRGDYKPSTTVANTTPTRVIPNGIFTVADGNGWITLKVDTPAWCAGKTVISYLNGPNNELCYEPFGFVTADGVKKWGRATVSEKVMAATQFLLTGSLDEARENFLNLAEAHAISSGNCLACLHTLTVPASVARGLGPICARRLGVN
jgi:hypothetical protein